MMAIESKRDTSLTTNDACDQPADGGIDGS
jgi:hypothetical protein